MKTKLLFVATLLVVQNLLAQWSTSTNADSALYVCPGFEPGILSLNDGSSYIAGGLSDYLYVQKLDPRGYKLWSQPVQVFNTPGTDNLGFFTMITDGLGGLIFVWKDYRGAYVGPDDYYNNAVYMQRVDKNGNILWQTNGVQIASVDGGIKEATIVDDGSGGAIVLLGESDFQRQGAAQKERLWIQHYNNNGGKLWNYLIDSSTSAFNVYPPSGLVRLDSITRIPFRNGFKFIDKKGKVIDTLKHKAVGDLYRVIENGAFEFIPLAGRNDSSGTTYLRTRIIKLEDNWDSVWTYDFERVYEPAFQFGLVANGVLSDGNDGIFMATSFENLQKNWISYVQNIASNGPRWIANGGNGLKFSPITVQALFSGKDQVGTYFGNGTAQKYNLAGQPLWEDSVVVFSNPSEAYSKVFASDNNGGCIVAFWTTLGGIYAQHSGRNGKLGIITSVNIYENNTIPAKYFISQNYPNPFNPATSFTLGIAQKTSVAIKVFDLLGREIQSIVNTTMQAGTYTVQWNGSRMASGIYFYTLEIDGKRVATHKMLLTK